MSPSICGGPEPMNSSFEPAWWIQAAVAVLTAAFLTQFIISLKTGVLPLRGGFRADRKEAPTFYWMAMLLYAVVILLLVWVVFTYIPIWLHRSPKLS